MPSIHVAASADITTWKDAHSTFQRASKLQQACGSIKLCNNTYLIAEWANDTKNADVNHGLVSYALSFHGSKIVRYYADGSIMLSSGGYRTATTKHRLNQFTDFSISQRAGEWYVDGDASAHTLAFVDGMRFTFKQDHGYTLVQA